MQRLLEVEAQHHLMMKAKLYYTHQLRATEVAKAQALRELQMADRTLKQLTHKLQTLTASKHASIEATGAAKIRTKELEEEKARRAQLGNEIFESVVNNQRELYRTSTAELVACQQELENLKQDFDEAVIERAALFRKAKEAEVELQKNQERQSQLKKEVDELRQKFDQVKLASDETEEDYMKLIVEKEELLHSQKSNKERVEKEIERLREEYVPTEILQEKLEETMEAIRVLQEQLHEIQSSDLHAIRQMAKELEEAKWALEEAVAEENSLHTLIDSTKWEVEDVKKRRVEAETVVLEAESSTEELQAELETSKAELEKAMSGCSFIMKSCVDKLLDEAEMAKYEAEASKKSAELLREEAKSAAALAQEADRKLQIALKEAEEAKALERLAEERIYCYQGNDDAESNGSGSTRKVRLSVEEFNSRNMKIEECAKKADIEVATANAQVEAINARERETSEKLEAMLKENEALQSEIREALKRAEMAEAARRLVETELQKWRQNEHSKTGRAK